MHSRLADAKCQKNGMKDRLLMRQEVSHQGQGNRKRISTVAPGCFNNCAAADRRRLGSSA